MTGGGPALLLLWAWLATSAHAALPVAPAVRVLLRLLSYDRALPARVADELRVAIIYDPHDSLSIEQSREAEATVKSLAGLMIDGLPLVGQASMIAEGPDAPSRLTGVGVVILCRGVEGVAALSSAAAHAQVILMTLDDAMMGAGPAVGVVQREARLEILVDRNAAQEQGVDLSSDVYQIVRLVGDPPR